MLVVPEETFPYSDPLRERDFEAAPLAEMANAVTVPPTVAPEVNRILEQVEAIDAYLGNQLAQRAKIATDPLYELFQRVVDGEVSEFEISVANAHLLSRNDDRWLSIIASIMDTSSAKLRDLRLHRLCELVVALQVIHYEIVGNVLYAWVYRLLREAYRVHGSAAALSHRTPRDYGLDFELELARQVCVPDEGFVGPIYEARPRLIRVRDLGDVSGDFAWSADLLARKYETMARRHAKKA